jgi:hypothetical protein
MSDGELKNTAQGLPEIKKWTEGKVIKKVIIVRDRLVSFVVE